MVEDGHSLQLSFTISSDRDLLRNVLLQIAPNSKASSEDGSPLTVLAEPLAHGVDADESVVLESLPSDPTAAADFIRIVPRTAIESA